MALPYERHVSVEQDGAGTVHTVDFPSRSFIEKIVITEVGGTQSFTVDVFNKNPVGLAGTDPEESYLVCAQLSVTSGKSKNFFDAPKSFFNNDASTNGRNPARIYLRFNTITTGDFVIAIGGSNDLI